MNGHSDHPLEATGPDEDLRDLFRRTTPESRPIDVERLLSKIARPQSPAPRRRWFTIAVAAAALLVAAGGVGWSAGSLEARRESSKVEAALRGEIERLGIELRSDFSSAVNVEATLRSELEGLRRELRHDFSRALVTTEEGVRRQLKRLAVLLRQHLEKQVLRDSLAMGSTGVLEGE